MFSAGIFPSKEQVSDSENESKNRKSDILMTCPEKEDLVRDYLNRSLVS